MNKSGLKICSVYEVKTGYVIIADESGNVYTAECSNDVGDICRKITGCDIG